MALGSGKNEALELRRVIDLCSANLEQWGVG